MKGLDRETQEVREPRSPVDTLPLCLTVDGGADSGAALDPVLAGIADGQTGWGDALEILADIEFSTGVTIEGAAATIVEFAAFKVVIVTAQRCATTDIGFTVATATHRVRAVAAVDSATAAVGDGAAFEPVVFAVQLRTAADIGLSTTTAGHRFGAVSTYDRATTAVGDGTALGVVIIAAHGLAVADVGHASAAATRAIGTGATVQRAAAAVVDHATFGVVVVAAQWVAGIVADVGCAAGAAGHAGRTISAVDG